MCPYVVKKKGEHTVLPFPKLISNFYFKSKDSKNLVV